MRLFLVVITLCSGILWAAEPEYIQKMESPDKAVRLEALGAARLGLMPRVDVAHNREIPPSDLAYKAAVKSALVKRLDDSDPEIQSAALDLLAMVYGKDAIDAEDKALKLAQSKNEYVRGSSIFLLAEMGSRKEAIRKAFVNALDDTSAGVRSHAIMAMSSFPDLNKLILKLTTLLSDKDATVRGNTIDAIMHLEKIPLETLTALTKCKSDQEEFVRTAASNALAKFNK